MSNQIHSKFSNISQEFRNRLNLGQLSHAQVLFDKFPMPNVYFTTLLVSAYINNNRPRDAIQLYQKLRKEKNIQPDNHLLLSVTKACALSSDHVKAREIHQDVIRFGLEKDLTLCNALIDMLGKCGYIDGAKLVFDNMFERDVITWTSLILSYRKCNMFDKGLCVFREMLLSCLNPKPNCVTLSAVLAICSEMRGLRYGKEIHCFVIRNKFEGNVFVSSGLVDVYSKCLDTKNARMIFDSTQRKDTVSWNVMLTAYFSKGDLNEALTLFEMMKMMNISINSASWNSMISGCVQNGKIEQAFQFFKQMQISCTKPDHVAIASILPACASMENIRGGKEIHAFAYRNSFIDDVTIITALLLTYAKCGDLNKSRLLFEHMSTKDIIAWNTMIVANSMHGCGEESLLLFEKMIASGINPNSVTFGGILSGCNHSQLVDKARVIFDSMKRDYGVEPDKEHYASMVDILSRSGNLDEAYEFILNMPMQPTASAWCALLNACKLHKNARLGKIAAEVLFEIEPNNPGNYILLLNIYCSAKMWDAASELRSLMKEREIRKEPGCSWVQIKSKVYTFVKGDVRFHRKDEVYVFLENVRERMKREGYYPDIAFVVQDLDGEEKEDVLCSHSEKLAVAFAIMNMDKGSVVRVFKNLRICGDCHNVISFVAKNYGVQITVRDNVRFHHFKDGVCSCRGRW